MSDRPPVVLCVSIDTECDKDARWQLRRPWSFRGVYEGIGQRLGPLFAQFGAKPTLLLSPEVMADDRAAELLRSLPGVELGTHLHGELIEPEARWDATETSAFQRQYTPAIERAKLQALTQLFRARFDRMPTAFRAGRFGIGPHSLGALAALGYRVDSSVTPGLSWDAVCPGLSFTDAPTHPTRVSAALWEVPVTLQRFGWRRWPLLRRFVDPVWLRPSRGSTRRLLAAARRGLRSDRHRPVVLNCMFHNVEVLAGLSPYAQSEAQAQALLARLSALLAWAQRASIRVIGLTDAVDVLEASPEAAAWA